MQYHTEARLISFGHSTKSVLLTVWASADAGTIGARCPMFIRQSFFFEPS